MVGQDGAVWREAVDLYGGGGIHIVADTRNTMAGLSGAQGYIKRQK